MSDRIKDIAAQYSTGEYYAGIQCWRFSENQLKSFAQQLVQECITIIAPTDEHRADASWGYLGGDEGVELLDELVERVKKHFGVE